LQADGDETGDKLMRVVIYARYSSDQQREASIDDQIRICRVRAEREGWQVGEIFSDHAISGATLLRPGYQALLAHLRGTNCDIVLAESLDRFSRDQEHIAAFYKQVSFAGARIFTPSEGEVSELHIGLKGTMGALYLKELAAKTHRGLAGRVLAGRCLGTVPYGYRKIRRLDQNGEPELGLREIDQTRAVVVRRIFASYAAGLSPIAIARALNDEGIPGPTGGIWCDTVIRGRPKRGDGMLRNPIYAGRLVWNRLHNTKDPIDGTRIRRINPEADLVSYDMPALAIVEPQIWHSVQQSLMRESAPAPARPAATSGPFWDRRRPRHLLTRKVFCGVCGQAFFRVGKDYLACRAADAHGCRNTARTRYGHLEGQVLNILGQRLMQPEPAEAFAKEFARCWAERQKQTSGDTNQQSRDLKTVEKRIGHLIDALAEGIRMPDIQARLAELERRRSELNAEISTSTTVAPVIPPDLASVYQDKLAHLRLALTGPDNSAALEIARGLVEKIIINPPTSPGEPPDVEMIGDLANLLKAGGFEPKPSEKQAVLAQVSNMLESSVKGELRARPLAGVEGAAPLALLLFNPPPSNSRGSGCAG
jgi:DNA invertase Pin-like site-specific DNA recombinase